MNIKEKQRHCIETDENSNEYCIPVEMQDIFNKMLNDESDEQGVKFDAKFGAFMLNMHVSNYSFVDFKETI